MTKFLELESFTLDNKFRLVIKEDLPEVGWYLIVYPSGGTQSLADHLQDTLDAVIKEAEEDYGVPPDSWRDI